MWVCTNGKILGKLSCNIMYYHLKYRRMTVAVPLMDKTEVSNWTCPYAIYTLRTAGQPTPMP